VRVICLDSFTAFESRRQEISDQLPSGALQELLTEFAPEPLPVNVVQGPADPLPLKVRCFLDWIAPRLRAQMAR
jgi:hypothetical protein